MFNIITIILILLTSIASTFFLGNNGCGCSTPSCSNPCPTLPTYNTPSHSKSFGVGNYQVPNELEMRAQLLGLDLNNPLTSSNTPSTYDFNKDLIPDIDLVDQQNVRRSPKIPSKDEEKVIELQDDDSKCNSDDLK